MTGSKFGHASHTYIPSEDPIVGVRQVTLDGRSRGLSLWPNPVRDELNIAWRGDLKRMPRRFEVHDINGNRLVSGSVPEGDGAAVWDASAHPAGVYILSVYDSDGRALAHERFEMQ